MYLGIDIGSLAAKAVLIDAEKRVIGQAVCASGTDHTRNAETLAARVLRKANVSRDAIRKVVGTGYGRRNVAFADLRVTEISCHARGAAALHKDCRTVVDIGGQDSKIILIDETGKVVDFSMNDRCAAGTGRFLEVMARTLEVPLEDMSTIAEKTRSAARISSICTVFAETEIVGLIACGETKERIIKGLFHSISEKIDTLVVRVGLVAPVVMTGGVALNQGVVEALEAKFGQPVVVPEHPQLAGALGAAIIALEKDR